MSGHQPDCCAVTSPQALADLLERRLKKSATKRNGPNMPKAVFIHPIVFLDLGPYPAMVVGDLMFWALNNRESSQPTWRFYRDWAQWFCCSERTLGRAVDTLRKAGVVTTERRRFPTQGHQGPLSFQLTPTFLGSSVGQDYRHLFADYTPEQGQNTSATERFVPQRLPLAHVHRYGAVNALILARLMGPIMGQDGAATFQSMRALATFCWVSLHQAQRSMDVLVGEGVLTKVKIPGYRNGIGVLLGPQGAEVHQWYLDQRTESEERHPMASEY
ncbi:hypothetical protein [Ferrimonas balearica]|uniref:hypothetical protein n=1 Tax=Ferrimonas balearica TaxID=44012 RepID=UPI001C99084D|nr:hypothetical protein [Ferrimonas balearica]MBY5920951.1 hypothetical protein [Ferrimonas balearica]MBY5996364.1 hypothetical protein [Ferrimonas balearica]